MLSVALLVATSMLFAQGNENTAVQSVTGDSNTAIADQNGNLNNGDQTVFGDQNRTYITQIGNSNTATSNQDAAAWQDDKAIGSYAQQIQIGYGNKSEVNQSGFYQQGYVYTKGNNNVASIAQYNDRNFASIYQLGHENYSRSAQAGSYNRTTMYQDGNGNHAYARVVNGRSNTIYVTELGNNNISTTFLEAGSDYNTINVTQNGFGNISGVNPYYSGDYGIFVNGDGNTVGLNQFGNNNVAAQIAVGSYNTININQH